MNGDNPVIGLCIANSVPGHHITKHCIPTTLSNYDLFNNPNEIAACSGDGVIVDDTDIFSVYNTIIEWLAKCTAKRPLTFRVSNIVNYALSHAKTAPMRLDTMQSKYPDMYKEIFLI